MSRTASDGRHSLDAVWRHDDRAIDEDWMRHHGVDQLIVRQRGIVQLQLVVGRSLFTQQIARGNPHAFDQARQFGPARRRLQIFDDARFGAAIADEAERVARGAASRIVVDGNVDGGAHA